MSPRAISVVLVAFLPACETDPTVVVARLQKNPTTDIRDAGVVVSGGGLGGYAGNPIRDAGNPIGDAGDPIGDAVQGPADAFWSLYDEDGEGPGTVQWGKPDPSQTSVTVVAYSPNQVREGLRFVFPSTRDLSKYRRLELKVTDFEEGDEFEVFLGRNLNEGCSYTFWKSDSYTADLANPAWCVPSQCGFDLLVREGLFLASVPDDSRLTATLSDIEFTVVESEPSAGHARALGGASGPGGYCWFLANWNHAQVLWKNQTPPNSSGAHVEAIAGTSDAIGGMAFEIPQNFNLAQYRTLQIVAVVSDLNTHEPIQFVVQAVKADKGFGWTLDGDGTQRTYALDLTQPTFQFAKNGGERLALPDVQRFEIVTPSIGKSVSIDARVNQVTFKREGE